MCYTCFYQVDCGFFKVFKLTMSEENTKSTRKAPTCTNCGLATKNHPGPYGASCTVEPSKQVSAEDISGEMETLRPEIALLVAVWVSTFLYAQGEGTLSLLSSAKGPSLSSAKGRSRPCRRGKQTSSTLASVKCEEKEQAFERPQGVSYQKGTETVTIPVHSYGRCPEKEYPCKNEGADCSYIIPAGKCRNKYTSYACQLTLLLPFDEEELFRKLPLLQPVGKRTEMVNGEKKEVLVVVQYLAALSCFCI